jgi:hypothetical protein
MKAGDFNNVPGFFRCCDMRDHDASRIRLKRLDVIAVTSLLNPNNGIHVVQPRGPHLVLDIEPAITYMFVAKPDCGETGQPAQFHDAWISEVDFRDGRASARAKLAQQTAGT